MEEKKKKKHFQAKCSKTGIFESFIQWSYFQNLNLKNP